MNLYNEKPPFSLAYRNSRQAQMYFHSHHRHEIYYFHEGRCNFIIGDRIHVLQPGDLILMHGSTLHCSNPDPAVSYIRSTIHFDPAIAERLLPYPGMPNPLRPFMEKRNVCVRLDEAQRAEIESLLLRLHAFAHQKHPIAQSRLWLAFLDLLYFLLPCSDRSAERTEQRQRSEKECHVQMVIDYLESNYSEELHLDRLARELYLSKHYLCKIFKEITGITIFNYLKSRRINQAKLLFMLNREWSVSDVSNEVGIKHLSHFSRLFKLMVGQTPEEYRRTVDTHSS
ncbi:MAG: transcriptional regulator, AraC family [Paenibacillus sp.]|nr:transcriptional regulator, AraC family [Paenibacillus sp.]